MSSSRRIGDGTIDPITPDLIVGWCAVTGERLCRQDIAIIRGMDAAFRDAVAKEHAEQRRVDAAKNK